MKAFVGIWILTAAVVQIEARVNVTVFYESLCPDSINFIKKQLHPTYKVLRDSMNVEFVPFGKAYITKKPWAITCQHGRNECLGNAVQACALDRTTDPQLKMDIVYCMMTDSSPPTSAKRCAKKLDINAEDIDYCAVNEEGRQLLLKNSEKTRRFRERLRFVPTVLFDGKYTSQDQKDALEDLRSVICQKLSDPLPDPCKEK